MEETYIQLYYINNKGIKWFVYFSFLLLSYGIFSLTGLLWFKEIVLVQHALWLSANFILQALVLLVVMYYAKKKEQYFISWSEHQIEYFFPKQKQPESITIQNIEQIELKANGIGIRLKTGTNQTLNLGGIFYPKRTQIKEHFEWLQNQIEIKQNLNK